MGQILFFKPRLLSFVLYLHIWHRLYTTYELFTEFTGRNIISCPDNFIMNKKIRAWSALGDISMWEQRRQQKTCELIRWLLSVCLHAHLLTITAALADRSSRVVFFSSLFFQRGGEREWWSLHQSHKWWMCPLSQNIVLPFQLFTSQSFQPHTVTVKQRIYYLYS